MELIERYLQAIGHHLPADKRADILSELRSSMDDSLEARGQSEPSEETVLQMIKEMGTPRKVAASYFPEGQYLIGPQLYPLFQLIIGISFTAIVGAQLIAIIVSVIFSHESISIMDSFWDVISGLPSALGFIVIIFAFLQLLDVKPELGTEEFDPRKLPALEKDHSIKRGELIFSIIAGTAFLAFLSRIAASGGFTPKGGTDFFTNPVLDQYFPLIAASMAVGILLDIILLWRGRWEVSTRVAKIAVNIFSMVVLYLLIQGHIAWLNQMGIHDFILTAAEFASTSPSGIQLIIMAGFRIGFSVAFIVTAIETVVLIYRLIWADRNDTVIQRIRVALINR